MGSAGLMFPVCCGWGGFSYLTLARFRGFGFWTLGSGLRPWHCNPTCSSSFQKHTCKPDRAFNHTSYLGGNFFGLPRISDYGQLNPKTLNPENRNPRYAARLSTGALRRLVTQHSWIFLHSIYLGAKYPSPKRASLFNHGRVIQAPKG